MNKVFYPLACFAWLFTGFFARSQAQCALTLPCPASPDTICDTSVNEPPYWNEMYWWDGVIETHDLPEGPADLCITAFDTCSGAALTLRYLLFLDLDGDGVQETVVNSDSLPPANTVFFNNAGNPGYSGGTPRAFDERGLNAEFQWRFALETTATAASTTACVRWNNTSAPNTYFVPELPYGQHKIRWIATNGLGDTTVCERVFRVQDCQPPEVACITPLSVNIMPTGLITLWATDFLQYAMDNVTPPTFYTPGNQLHYAIRKAGQGTGYPLDAFGQPVTSVAYTCDELGTQTIELWAKDAAGNVSFCETYVIVQDPWNNCQIDPPVLQVCAKSHCDNQGIESVYFELDINNPNFPSINLDEISDNTGCAQFSNALPLSPDYTITPEKDDNPMNGVSTFDLVLMSKHILAIEPLNSPYKIVAADVNKSNSVTTFDIVELRKLILGVYSELPNNTSWRFISQAFQFSNPQNPFASAPFPENITIADWQSNNDNDFVGIKIGDLNCSAIANLAALAEERVPVPLVLPDLTLAAGETVEIPVSVADPAAWLGFQFALQADPNVLLIEPVQTGALPELTPESFARSQSGRLAVSWFDARPHWVAPDEPLFTLRLHALAPVRLRNVLTLDANRLVPEAYDGQEQRSPLALTFRGNVAFASGLAAAVFPAQPNPTTTGAVLPLRLPVPAPVRLEVFDLTGKTLFFQEIIGASGFQALEIPAAVLPQAGVYLWKLVVDEQIFTGRLVRQ